MKPNPSQQRLRFVRYENEYGVDITRRIDNGLTKVFEDENQAMEHAARRRSYHFQIFQENKRVPLWGVPQ